MNFDFFMPVKVVFGPGRKKDLGKLVGNRKTLIVTDSIMVKLGLIDSIRACINAEVLVYDGVEPNPTVESVNEATRIGRAEKIECVIGVGGGSSMDAAKAVATMINAEGGFEDYFYGASTITRKRVGLFVMPT
ncbi:MAG: iron-containing alcohol dehydrogenase, partial [Betaproteobacteria bacterium]